MKQDWEIRLLHVLSHIGSRERSETIAAIADLALEATEQEGDAWLDGHPDALALRRDITRLYYEYIVDNETQDVRRLLASTQPAGTPFKQLAGEKGRVAYDRVGGMFGHVDFSRCRRFTMVGCGQLPVTALHVMERAQVPECVVVDLSGLAIESATKLKHRFGWDAIQPVLADGKDFDYAGADVVYIANMVQSKVETVRRVLATAAAGTQLVVRDPYSLGRLWAEKAEPHLAGELEVTGRGPVSRHLSRDLFMRRR